LSDLTITLWHSHNYGIIRIPIMHMRKLGLKEDIYLAKDHIRA
jgi:hypothetical protein